MSKRVPNYAFDLKTGAAHIGVSYKTLLRLIHSGEIDAHRFSRKKLLVKEKDLRNWVDDLKKVDAGARI